MQKEQLDAIRILEAALIKNKNISKPYLIAKQIERSIHRYVYNYSSDNYKPLDWNNYMFLDLYVSTLQKIEQHINPDSDINKTFGNYTINAIINGKLDIDKLAEYKSEELNPKAQQKERTEYEISSNQKIEWKVTELYTCDKCKKNKCSYYAVQTRTADEAETVFYKCCICGNEWSTCD